MRSTVTFYSAWQPLHDEDAQTGLVFGFVRHAPVEHVLNPWLTDMLGRDTSAEPLGVDAFWPSYESVVDSHTRTVPELVFDAADEHGDLVIAIEAKRHPSGHDLHQLVREAIDTAHTTCTKRLAVVMVSVDIGQPPQRAEWESHIRSEMRAYGLADATAELHYSSWARLGKHIEDSLSAAEGILDVYAKDVLAQMELNGLLGYRGAPMPLENKSLNIPNAFNLVNSTIKQGRHFFLALTGHSRFGALGLAPIGGSHTMLRDGAGTRALTQAEGWFETTTLLAHFRGPDWIDGRGVFAAFFLPTEEEHPHLCAGAYASGTTSDIQYSFAWAAATGCSELDNLTLRGGAAPLLTECAVYKSTGWRFAVRSWEPGDPEGDLDWTLNALAEAVELWEGAGQRAIDRLRERKRPGMDGR